ncbi:1,4-alpha-glucan branching protein GlgB [Phaeovulum vinaykumarii]|uniref:1,4-alpha-glucan branching enzyme GlgB n=1 Tax=Phaeovulum vinaykumarii TaxID=407234 RepID=A0A1N7LIG4_9RHOB|nr:1,4-alpha-glucan branching protein GlgB [Phaeovulum vinaykumarii]SIS73593.1 1,4-alpha-glucan branching enzyme [Phaeovulum vinaykumarii]SOC04719.1 1,4-alpha-glucan branching enzyme [Phaeovulum vinaykumarii]
MTLIDPAAAQALAEGRHSDPFSVLGLHPDGAGGWRIAALVPGAAQLWALPETGGDPVEMTCVGPALFVCRWPGPWAEGGAYRLRGFGAWGAWDFDDPYRFGPVLGEIDEYLIGEGRHRRLWQALGAHPITHEGVEGTHFAVWAPAARRVSVVGEFNHWNGLTHPMRARGATGVWEIFLPGVREGARYKFEIKGPDGCLLPLKADPVGFGAEHPPLTASVVRRLGTHGWGDHDWLSRREAANRFDAPISIYEVHLGSWRRVMEEGGRPLSYHELSEALCDYVRDLGFTHIELMPIHEHPFDGSWGYQPVGLYAPTVRHGTAQEFAGLIDAAHQRGLGVILDWVPGHFPTDAHGLARFDGTALYEHADPREGFHRDWNTLIYNFGRREVANYLLANALYWLEEYHVDGLRVDAVASMLYRDYSRPEGEWVPNIHGGRENLEAIEFLRAMNAAAYGGAPGIMTVAEESTAFPKVSAPVHEGGLGFGFKWNMGWMNDSLRYMAREPIHRRWHHNEMTFASSYAWTENFILPISHDEVVHGKGSMLGKMPGSWEEKFANLRAFYAFMWAHPGKKLLFMGQEFAQVREWAQAGQLDWSLLDYPLHAGMRDLIRDLNRLYRDRPAMSWGDGRPEGFAWIDADDAEHSVYAFERRAPGQPPVVFVVNFTPIERSHSLRLPQPGPWREILNTDAGPYGGGNRGNMGRIEAREGEGGARAEICLPPLTALLLEPEGA